MPSKWEGFGLAFLEAMAYARPIIGGARDATPEILGDAALLVDPENIDQLADAIIRLLSERICSNSLELPVTNASPPTSRTSTSARGC